MVHPAGLCRCDGGSASPFYDTRARRREAIVARAHAAGGGSISFAADEPFARDELPEPGDLAVFAEPGGDGLEQRQKDKLS